MKTSSQFRGDFAGRYLEDLLFHDFIPKSSISRDPCQRGMIPIHLRRNGFQLLLFSIAVFALLFTLFYKGETPRVSLQEQNSYTRRHLNENSSTNSCEFIKSHPDTSGGFINYLSFFYCHCKDVKFIGYSVMFFWLVILFYLLGNTAADYFCLSLEKLSGLLRLPPTVAGVTLLPLGNGAPDVFASIAAFVGSGSGEVGVNGVLGGAVFVTCVVVGIVSLVVSEKGYQIDRRCFIRDIVFFLLTIFSLGIILINGKISLIGSLLFSSLYLLYAFSVAANEMLRKQAKLLNLESLTPLLPVRGNVFSSPEEEEEESGVSHAQPSTLPQWMWASNLAIYSNRGSYQGSIDNPRPLWGWADSEEEDLQMKKRILSWLQIPLSLPRKLTIPIVDEERWSKGYAVCSAFLSPILLVVIVQGEKDLIVISVVAGACFSILAFFYTRTDHPPRRFLFPWVLAGFVMSIVWFYIIANELVSLLVSLGKIFSVDPAVLALTVLAWGNSMGDLSSNVALAVNGEDGVQIAMSGCYAGPIFNTLIGLGASMVLSAWSTRPIDFDLRVDPSLALTFGFLVMGLLWALTLLTRNEMRPSKLLGIGLLTLYAVFLCVRISAATGFVSSLTFMGMFSNFLFCMFESRMLKDNPLIFWQEACIDGVEFFS